MNLLRIYVTADGTVGREFKNYSSYDTALTALHTYMSNGIADSNIKSTVCEVIDDNGAVIKIDSWAETTEEE